MVDDFHAIRCAPSPEALQAAYARWLAEHCDAAPMDMRRARAVYRGQVRAWAHAPDPQAAADPDLPAGEDWQVLRATWPGSPPMLAVLEARLVAEADSPDLAWESGPEAERCARWIRDAHPAVFACAPSFFAPHVPVATLPPARTRASVEEQPTAHKPGPGLFDRKTWWIWGLAIGLMWFSHKAEQGKQARKRSGAEGTPSSRRSAEDPGTSEFVALQRLLVLREQGAPGPQPTEAELLHHLEAYGRSESRLRAQIAAGTFEGSRSLRRLYERLLDRLDEVREGR